MTLPELDHVLKDVRFPLYVFHAGLDDGQLWLRAAFYVPQLNGGTRREHTSHWRVAAGATEDDVLRIAATCVLASVWEQTLANFTYRGEAVFVEKEL
jgi:hypothetical protein